MAWRMRATMSGAAPLDHFEMNQRIRKTKRVANDLHARHVKSRLEKLSIGRARPHVAAAVQTQEKRGQAALPFLETAVACDQASAGLERLAKERDHVASFRVGYVMEHSVGQSDIE